MMSKIQVKVNTYFHINIVLYSISNSQILNKKKSDHQKHSKTAIKILNFFKLNFNVKSEFWQASQRIQDLFSFIFLQIAEINRHQKKNK